MKIGEFNEEIATACDMRARAVSAVQKETFRLLRAALEKGERVQIPEFGTFSVKDVPGKDDKPARKIVRLRMKGAADGETRKGGDAKKTAKKNKKAAKDETQGAGQSLPADTPAE